MAGIVGTGPGQNRRMNTADADLICSLAALYVHPIKSCGGVALQHSELVETGLDLDRQWMVVDEHGEMLTQRELPRMALIQPTLRDSDMVLRAPGMLALHVRLDTVEAATRVRVWDDVVKAFDMGALAAQWFSDFLGRKLRLARFDPEERRLSNARWAGDIEALNGFADAFPLLVANQASLEDLNTRLAAQGAAPVTMQRFRPNLVLSGVQAYEEDHLHEIEINTGDQPVVLRLVKPCVRCTIPNVDPLTAASTPEVGDTLAGYRADARMNGGITFGVNAVVVSGYGQTLRCGQAVRGTFRFD